MPLFWQNTAYFRKPQLISGKGGGNPFIPPKIHPWELDRRLTMTRAVQIPNMVKIEQNPENSARPLVVIWRSRPVAEPGYLDINDDGTRWLSRPQSWLYLKGSGLDCRTAHVSVCKLLEGQCLAAGPNYLSDNTLRWLKDLRLFIKISSLVNWKRQQVFPILHELNNFQVSFDFTKVYSDVFCGLLRYFSGSMKAFLNIEKCLIAKYWWEFWPFAIHDCFRVRFPCHGLNLLVYSAPEQINSTMQMTSVLRN